MSLDFAASVGDRGFDVRLSVAAGDAVEGIEFPESSDAVNTYPITVVKASEAAEVARAFVDLVTGSEGQEVLADAGFGTP